MKPMRVKNMPVFKVFLLAFILLLLPTALALTETGTYDEAKAGFDALGDSAYAEQCRSLLADEYADCITRENWELDVQAALINHDTGEEELVDMLIQGDNDCPYTTAVGSTIPEKIKGETRDAQNQRIEVVCQAYCYSWDCPEDGELEPERSEPLAYRGTLDELDDLDELKDEASIIAAVNRGIKTLPQPLVPLLKDQQILVLIDEEPYSAVFIGSTLSRFTPGKPEKPTLRIVTSSKTIEKVSTAADPASALIRAVNRKEVMLIGHTLGNKMLTALGTIGTRRYAQQLVKTYEVPKNQQRIVTIGGQQATLTKNALNQRIANLPHETRVITNYGMTAGYTTPGAQRFIQRSPARYTPSAGVYYRPAQSYYTPAAPGSFLPNWETFNSGSGLIIIGSGGASRG